MFIVFYSFIATDWRKTDYWMILGMRLCTSGLSNSGQRKSLSTVRWEQEICREYSASLYSEQGQMLFSDSLRVLNLLWGVGLQCREAAWMPMGMQITRLEVLPSPPTGTLKTTFVELLPFHSYVPKMLHIKPVYLGLVFSWKSLVVFSSVFP